MRAGTPELLPASRRPRPEFNRALKAALLGESGENRGSRVRSKYSNIVIVLAAILAFVPVLAVDYAARQLCARARERR